MASPATSSSPRPVAQPSRPPSLVHSPGLGICLSEPSLSRSKLMIALERMLPTYTNLPLGETTTEYACSSALPCWQPSPPSSFVQPDSPDAWLSAPVDGS